jgi:hypothetical protein
MSQTGFEGAEFGGGLWGVGKVAEGSDELGNQVFVGLGNEAGKEPGFVSQPEAFDGVQIG